MCGRTACALCPDDVRKACSYQDKSTNNYRQPEWHGTNHVYKPSYNVCPTDVTPVMVAGSHFDRSEQRLLVSMIWGMIPPWHKGDIKSHGLTTHNCRLEGVTSSKLFKIPLTAGRRCVIVCDGFYEWQTTKGNSNKKTYFIYKKQMDGISVVDGKSGTWSESSGWSGPALLHIAGLFNSTKTEQGETAYSYSMVTMESDSHFNWLHHRVPAILETDEEIASWLDYKLVPTSELLPSLNPVSSLAWHQVGNHVGNCRNKDSECNKPIDKRVAKPTMMMKWLQKELPSKRSNTEGKDESLGKTGTSDSQIVKRSKPS